MLKKCWWNPQYLLNSANYRLYLIHFDLNLLVPCLFDFRQADGQNSVIPSLELGDKKPRFTTIIVNIKVCVLNDKDIIKVEKVFKKLKKSCLISNSINTDVIIKPEIVVNHDIGSKPWLWLI